MSKEETQLRIALGLLSTLAPEVVMNVDDPVSMAKEIEASVLSRIVVLAPDKEIAFQRWWVSSIARELIKHDACRMAYEAGYMEASIPTQTPPAMEAFIVVARKYAKWLGEPGEDDGGEIACEFVKKYRAAEEEKKDGHLPFKQS